MPRTTQAEFGRGTGRPHPHDLHVGKRLRQRRLLLGWTQESLGERLGLTFQQVQKYERGSNRIGASRLFELSQLLGVDVGYFFEGLSAPPSKTAASHGPGLGESPASYGEDPFASRETLELVRAYRNIADPALRRRFLDMCKALGQDGATRPPRRHRKA